MFFYRDFPIWKTITLRHCKTIQGYLRSFSRISVWPTIGASTRDAISHMRVSRIKRQVDLVKVQVKYLIDSKDCVDIIIRIRKLGYELCWDEVALVLMRTMYFERDDMNFIIMTGGTGMFVPYTSPRYGNRMLGEVSSRHNFNPDDWIVFVKPRKQSCR